MRVTVENLHKSYATEEGLLDVLRGVDLSIGSTERVALTGESGSGKSTLLHLIGGLDGFEIGDIRFDDQSLKDLDEGQRATHRRDRVGIVFQQFNLIPSLPVSANIAFHARLANRLDEKWQDELIDRLGLSPFLRRYPEQLSGGQQQRVALARTLCAKPSLILADEPTGNLDEENSDTVIDLLLEMSETASLAVLMVTHSSRMAARMDRTIHLERGRISQPSLVTRGAA